MGLAVVHGIIQGHGGSVSVESELGKGTAFHCYFPVIEGNNQDIKPDIKPENAAKGDEHILFVDDDVMVLDMSAEILRTVGYRVTSCSGSREALEIFKNRPGDFDLVITDHIMPEMNGTTLSKALLKIRSDIPIVLASGTLFNKKAELRAAGIRNLLQKPFALGKMQSVIREVLDMKA